MRILIFLLLPAFLWAQQLSPQSFISVITCGPGQTELYSAFGHSAFRVYDPVLGLDEVYNYGVFDFSQPNFYLNFARGNNYYKLAVQHYPHFEYFYRYYNRFIHEQVLNLNTHQKQRLFEFLQWNALPENCSYRYDYFYDNCATKIPTVLKHLFGDSLRFNYQHINTGYSFRQLTDLYLSGQPWGDLGIDLCLGLPMDKKATPHEYMFLPDFVEAGLDNATLNNLPVVKQKNIIYQPIPVKPVSRWLTPMAVFSTLLAVTILITFRNFQHKKTSIWFDRLFFGTAGLLGIVLLLLWIATDHWAAAWNFNLLWALPTHIITAGQLKKTTKWLAVYFKATALILLLLLLFWFWLPQQMNTALVPVVVSLLLRAWINMRVRSKLW